MESLVMERLALQPAAAAIFAQNMPACTHVFVGVVAPVFKFIVRDGVACTQRSVVLGVHPPGVR
jgi:hypothetical protein